MRRFRTPERMARGPGYALVLGLVIPFAAWNGFIEQVNSSFRDIFLRLRRPVASPTRSRILLLAIDDATASRFGPLPLRRGLLARGLASIASAHPKVLVVDLLLSEAGDPAQDAELAAVLSRYPKVVLAAALQSDPAPASQWIEPLPQFRTAARVGHAHAAPDPDGEVRSVLLAKAGAGRRYWALGLEAALAATGQPRPVETREAIQAGPLRIPAAGASGRQMLINYAGPEGTFERLSFASVLDGTVNRGQFRGKIVILGVTALGSGDRMFTPLSSVLGMSGIEIHANIVRTILDGAYLKLLDAAAEWLVFVVIAAACAVLIRRFRGLRLVGALAGEAVALPAACWIALRGGQLWPLASMATVFLAAAALLGAGEYAAIAYALRASEDKRKAYAFRLQSITHEIKTPLTAIQGSSEMISEGMLGEQQRAEMAHLIYRESKRLNQVLQVFLDLERMSSGVLELRKGPVNAESLCAEVLERARLYAARKRIRIEACVAPVRFQADPDLLSFALYNLLTNAVKYSPKGSAIRMEVTGQDSAVVFTVADQGYGIAPSEQKRIFAKFYRMGRDEAGGEPGSGIGLTLVREIAALHGGRVAVESAPGAGSRFSIRLPGAGS